MSDDKKRHQSKTVDKSTIKRKAVTNRRRRTRLLALEPRVLFDGALALDIGSHVAQSEASDASSDTTSEVVLPAALIGSESQDDTTSSAQDFAAPSSDAVDDPANVSTKDSSRNLALDGADLSDSSADLSANAPTSGELLFVDGAIKGYEHLLPGVREGVEVIILDPTRDGYAQITEALASRKDVAAVHLVTHGEAGRVALGDSILSAQEIEQHSEQVGAWSASLSPGADFLIYGCDAGSGMQGQSLLNALSSATGADVAASEDLTGSGPMGSNWTLEVSHGEIQTHPFADPANLAAFESILAQANVDLNGPALFVVSDNFDTATYTGGSNWTGGWLEFDASPTRFLTPGGSTNSDNSPLSGNIVYGTSAGGGNELTFVGQGMQYGDYIQREVNLRAYESATLSFSYRMASLEADDLIEVSISKNSGANFFSLGTLNYAATANTTLSFDISNYISDETVLRFTIKSGFTTNDDRFYFDNVAITADGDNFSSTFVEDGSAVAIAGAATLISDADAGQQLTSATITLTNAKAGDVLAFGTMPSGITATVNGAGTEITLSGTASSADYANALKAISFSNTSGRPDISTRVITVTVTDAGAETSLPATAYVKVVAIDDLTDAVNDVFTAPSYGTFVGNVMTNDVDPDTAGLSVETTLVSNPASGVVVMSSDGSFTYTPNAIVPGGYTDTFTYRLVSLAQVPGANYEYWSAVPPGWTGTTGLAGLAGNAMYTALGSPNNSGYLASGFNVDDAAGNSGDIDLDNFIVRFTSQITVTTAGTYTFWSGSDDGSMLYVDGQMVVANDGAHSWIENSSTVYLTAGTHSLMADFFEIGGQEDLMVSYSGPDTGGLKTDLNNVGGVLAPTFDTATVTINVVDGGPRVALGGNLYASDAFATQSYGNNTGTINWTGNWSEANDDASATAGQVRVLATGTLQIQDTSAGASASLTRGIDMLSVSGTAPTRVGTTLSFNYDATALTAGKVDVQMTADGGATWTTVGSIESSILNKTGVKTYDVSNFAVSNAQLRFVAQDGVTQPLSIDNVRVDQYQVNHSATFTENSAPVAIASATTAIADPTGDNLSRATITLTNAQAGDVLSYGTLPGGITATVSGNVVTLTGTATRANYAAALQQVYFGNSSDAVSTVTRTINVAVTDVSGIISNTAVATIAINAINDAPAGTDRAMTLVGTGSPYVIKQSDFGFTDIDGNALNRVLVSPASSGALQWNNGATWVAVSAPQYVTKTDIDANRLRFNPSTTGTASFTFQVEDDGATGGANQNLDASANSFTISVVATNTAPGLSGNLTLTTGTEDVFTAPSRSISQLLTDSGVTLSDPDVGSSLSGLAITANTANASTQGIWQYSTDGSTWNSVGTVAEGATALALSSSTQLRFVPVADYNGAPPALTLRALDNTYNGNFTSGATRVTIDTTTRGGTTAIAGTSRTIGTTVAAVNDAPVMTAAAPALTTITEDQTGNNQQISTMLGATVSDIDAGAVEGIAVIGAGGAGGTWQYSPDGTTWTNIGVVDTSAALLLRATDHLRFLPDGTNAGTGALMYRAWDQSSGTVATKVDTAISGGTSAFSGSVNTLSAVITGLNDAPVLADTALGLSVVQNALTPTGAVGSPLSSFTGAISDVDAGAVKGIAITGTVTTNGTWYYTTDGGTTWTSVGAVSNTSALLLAENANTRLYFAPNPGYSGTADALTLRAWDQTSGTVGTKVTTATNGGTSAFSSATDTISVTVSAPPVIDLNASDASVSANETFTTAAYTNASTGGIAWNGNWTETDAAGGAGSATAGNVRVTGGELRLTQNGSIAQRAVNLSAYSAGYVSTLSFGWRTDSGVDLGADIAYAEISTNSGSTWTTLRTIDAGPSGSGTVTADVSAYAGANTVIRFRTNSFTGGTEFFYVDNVVITAQPTSFTATFTEGSAAVAIADTDTLITDDGANLAGATITITNAFSGDLLSVSGSLPAGISIDPASTSTTVILTGSATKANYETAIEAIRYSNSSGAPNTTTRSVTVSVTDTSGLSSNVATSVVSVVAVNTAPDLGDTVLSLNSVGEDAGAPTGVVGTLVSSLIGGVTDPDSPSLGIAVTGVSSGSLWYSTDNGTNWTAFTPSDASSRLLAADANTRIYFAPGTANFNGTINSAITFRAWDQSTGTNGGAASTTVNGGTTAFSSATDTASVVVTPVNDAPVLADTSLAFTIAQNASPPVGPVGSSVASFTNGVTDIDAGAVKGIAITGTVTTNGTWYYTTNGGTTWTSVGAVSNTSALLLADDGNTRLYFQPNANYTGTADALTLRAWDQTSGTAGTKVTTATNGGTSAFSSATDFISVTVSGTPPVIDLNASDASVSANETFTTAAYTNASTGGIAWNGNWTETDAGGGGATGGNVLVTGGELRLTQNGSIAQRAVNLSAYSSGFVSTLSFGWRTNAAVDLGADIAYAEISTNSGSTWTTLRTIDGGPSGTGTVTADVSGYAGANTVIRFRTNSFTSGTAEYFYVDNVVITAQPTSFTATFTEGSAAVAIADTDTLITDDGANLAGATITITNAFSGDLLSVSGSLPAGITLDPASTSTMVILTGSATKADYETAIEAIRFSNSSDAPNTTNRSVTVVVQDSTGLSSNAAASVITVVAQNDAPVLADTALALGSVAEDGGAPSGAVGTLVSTLVGGVSDPDGLSVPKGIAVTGTNSANGTWYYSTDGSTWTAFTGGNSTSRLLSADANTRIYFQPNANFNGTVATGITFRAWDQTTGSNGGTADTTINGGITAFSAATDTASIAVTAVNDAPVATGSATLASISEEATNPAGATVSSLFGATFGDSADNQIASGGSSANTLSGIAVVDYTTDLSKGVWQFSSNGTTWTTLASTVPSVSITLQATDHLRFVPNADYGGAAPTLTVRLIDSSGGAVSTNASINLSAGASYGGSTRYSGNTTTLDTMVTPVADAPTVSVTPASGVEDAGAIALSFSGSLNDTDGSESISYYTISNVPAGATLSVGTNLGGGVWTVTPAQVSGLTLTPAADFNGTINLSVSGTTTESLNGATATSSPQTLAVTVTAVNDAPVLGDTGLTLTVAEDAGVPSGAVGSLLSSFTGGITDVDSGSVKGIAITGSNETNGTWYYSTNSGTTWTAVGAVSNTSALLLADNGTTRLYFAPAADYNGTATSALTIRGWDTTSGTAGTKVTTATNGGTSAFSSATDVIDVTVTAVNDAPVLATGSTLGYTENGAAAAINTTITVSDVDNATLSTGTVSITGGFATGEDVLSFTNVPATMGNIVGSYNATTGVMSLS